MFVTATLAEPLACFVPAMIVPPRTFGVTVAVRSAALGSPTLSAIVPSVAAAAALPAASFTAPAGRFTVIVPLSAADSGVSKRMR